MRSILSIAGNSVFRALLQSRFYFIIFINITLIKQLTDSIKDFSELTGVKAVPCIFPFLMQQTFIQLLFLVGATMLFCDAPFINQGSSFEMIRTGKKKWLLGKLMYVVGMSFIYTASLMLVSGLLLFPKITFQKGWGKALLTLAQTNAASVLGNDYIRLDYGLMLQYEPLEAMLMSGLMAWVVCLIVGVCILVINLSFERLPGAVGGILIAMLPYFQKNFSNLHTMLFFSPGTWMNITFWNTEIRTLYPTVSYMVIFFILSIAIMVGISFFRLERVDDILKRKGEY